MIYLYSGTPGSGKSLHAAQVMKNWIHIYKAPVIGNFEFKAVACRPRGFGSFLFVKNQELHPELLVEFSEQYKKVRKWKSVPEEHLLLVIDECQLIFNARTWNEKGRSEWISFFSQHRKLGYRVILIAQYDLMIDRQIRSLIEYEYIHRKVKNIGMYGKILNMFTGGNLHIAVKKYKPLEEKIGQDFFKADANLYALYDSYSRF